MPTNPGDLVARFVGQKVTLALKDGRELVGDLRAADEHMNLHLENAEERREGNVRRLGAVVLRGSNVVSLHAPDAVAGRSK